LAVVTKYPAIVVAPIIVLAHVVSKPKQWLRPSRLVGSGVASFAGVILASPFLLPSFAAVLKDVALEARPAYPGATGEGTVLNLIWYLNGPLPHALSIVALMLACVGIVLSAISREKARSLLTAFPIFLLIFISSLNLRWERWIVPAVPFLCLLAATAFIGPRPGSARLSMCVWGSLWAFLRSSGYRRLCFVKTSWTDENYPVPIPEPLHENGFWRTSLKEAACL